MSDPVRLPAHPVRRSEIRVRTEATCETRGCAWRKSPADGQACRVHVEATGHKVVLSSKSTSTYYAKE